MNAWQNSGHFSQKVINRRNTGKKKKKSLTGGSFQCLIFTWSFIYLFETVGYKIYLAKLIKLHHRSHTQLKGFYFFCLPDQFIWTLLCNNNSGSDLAIPGSQSSLQQEWKQQYPLPADLRIAWWDASFLVESPHVFLDQSVPPTRFSLFLPSGSATHLLLSPPSTKPLASTLLQSLWGKHFWLSFQRLGTKPWRKWLRSKVMGSDYARLSPVVAPPDPPWSNLVLPCEETHGN